MYDPLVRAGGTCDITQPLRIHKHNTLLPLHCQGRSILYMYSKSTIKGTLYIYIYIYIYIDASLFTAIKCVPSLFQPVTSIYMQN